MDKFVPLLTTTDWNAEWKMLQQVRHRADSAEYWDERAKTFGHKDMPNPYVDGFIEHMRLEPGDTVFDMGCGNGALALPLAAAGHGVFAADFSRGMLDRLEEDARAKGLHGAIFPIQMSWADDWTARGVREDSVDVAIASRSIATDDLEDALMRLDRVARKRCCISLSTSASPRIDERVLVDLGLQPQLGRDYLYAFNILASNNRKPEVCYLENARHDHYGSLAEAHESLGRMLGNILALVPESERADLEERFLAWRDADLIEDTDADGTPFWRLSQPRQTKWALISWQPA